MKAAIVGIAGPELLAEEAALFRAHPPAGVILFARNIQDRPQLAALMAALRRVLPPNAVFMVDQEGGRVARLRPPHWRAHPPAAALRYPPPRLAQRCADRAGLRRRRVQHGRGAGARPVGSRARTTSSATAPSPRIPP